MSGLSPAWSFASASDSFVMYVNFGLSCGCCLTYCANIVCPPSLPYPAQSSTCSAPVSAASRMPAASASAARPPTSPAPPAAAASLRTSARVSLRWNESPCLVIPSSPLFVELVAGRADHDEHLCRIVAGVAHAMGGRAAVVHAVAGAEVVHVGAELDVHPAPYDDENLLGVSVRVRLVAGGAAWFELRGDDLERVERLGREERLPAEMAPDEELARLPPEHAGARQAIGREEVGDVDPERRRELLQRGDARVRAAPLE